MGKKLVIGSSGQIGVELTEQLAKDFGANQIIAADIKSVLNVKNSVVEYVTLDILDKDLRLTKDSRQLLKTLNLDASILRRMKIATSGQEELTNLFKALG